MHCTKNEEDPEPRDDSNGQIVKEAPKKPSEPEDKFREKSKTKTNNASLKEASHSKCNTENSESDLSKSNFETHDKQSKSLLTARVELFPRREYLSGGLHSGTRFNGSEEEQLRAQGNSASKHNGSNRDTKNRNQSSNDRVEDGDTKKAPKPNRNNRENEASSAKHVVAG